MRECASIPVYPIESLIEESLESTKLSVLPRVIFSYIVTVVVFENVIPLDVIETSSIIGSYLLSAVYLFNASVSLLASPMLVNTRVCASILF